MRKALIGGRRSFARTNQKANSICFLRCEHREPHFPSHGNARLLAKTDMKLPMLFAAVLFSLTMVKASAAEDERAYQVYSGPDVLQRLGKEEEKEKVLAWFKKVDPERWAEIGGDENEQFEVLAIEYFINGKHKEGWELMFMQNNAFFFKKIVRKPPVPSAPIPH